MYLCIIFCSICFFCLSIRPPPRSTRTDTLFPSTTLFRSIGSKSYAANATGAIPAGGLTGKYSKDAVTPVFGLVVKPAEGVSLYANRVEGLRSEEHTSELQSLMRTSYAVFCLKKKIHLSTCMYYTLQMYAIRNTHLLL